jgi:hypothetical protein
MVSRDADVCEGDFGRQTAQAGEKNPKFDPADGWSKVKQE